MSWSQIKLSHTHIDPFKVLISIREIEEIKKVPVADILPKYM